MKIVKGFGSKSVLRLQMVLFIFLQCFDRLLNISQGLFTITGIGLIPSRVLDTYREQYHTNAEVPSQPTQGYILYGITNAGHGNSVGKLVSHHYSMKMIYLILLMTQIMFMF